MAVSSLKGCWYKFSARIRDYLDVVDSYYRPPAEGEGVTAAGDATDRLQASGDRIGGHVCDKSNCCAKDKHRNGKSGHRHRHHRHHHACTEQAWMSKYLGSSTAQQLLPGFVKRKTSQGQIYFMDATGAKYWFDPSVPKELLTATLDLDSLVGKLPLNWEIRQTQSGKTYYVNHTRKTTQFTDPRLVVHKDHLMAILKREQCTATLRAGTLVSSGRQNGVSTPSSTGQNPSQNASSRPSSTSTKPHLHMCPRSHHHNYHSENRTQHDQHNSSSNSMTRRQICTAASLSHHDPHNQYHLNLLSGSHHNLSTTTNHSNTLTGPPPSWFKPSTLASLRKKVTANTTNGSTCHQHDTSNTATAPSNRTNSHNINRSGSVSNLSPIYANNTSSYDQQQGGVPPRANKELFDKISILRQELLKQQVIAHPCKIDVSRKRIFEESFRVVSQMQPRDLKKRLLVKFRGEEGLDYGGVAREWFYLLSREILNPVHGLFQYTSDDIYNLQINPDSGIVYREHLSYLNFCGRVIGMAVFHGHFIEGHFTLPFYKMLLKKPITLEDIEFVDPELHRSLCWILENDITNVIDTTFLVQHNAFGQLQEHELKDNGRNTVVTEDNKQEYVSLYVNYRCRRGIESQFEALQRGFYELISPSLVENFDEYELELLIGGLSKINIEDWRIHTKLKNCTVESPLVRWFWDIVKSYGEDKRARLLQFVTGSPRVPIQGFKALQGVNSELRLFTIHLIKNACTDNLPKSHTCFNRIDLPPYESYDKLRDKLTQAIEETMGFAMQ